MTGERVTGLRATTGAGVRALVTGLGGELGTRVALLLEARPEVEAVSGLDIEPPRRYLERTDFHGSYGYYHYAMNRPVIAPLGESVSTSSSLRGPAFHAG